MNEIPQGLIEKYAVSVPRYTSYPTAVEFSDHFGPVEWQRLLREEFLPSKSHSLSLYFHIPFCRQLCYFCACNKIITEDRSLGTPYVDTLVREMDLIAENAPGAHPIEQIHWGGGSPNFLSPNEMERLHRETLARFPDLTEGAEISIELDPRTTTEAQLEVLRRSGFNRISFGVQDFDPVVQESINRVQSFEETSALARLGRALGFSGLNLDLIYGLPEQSVHGFGETLKRVLEIRPDRIALYGYAHVTWLHKVQNSFRKFHLPLPEERIAIFQLAVRELLAAGYEHIGLDHFALPSDTLTQSLHEGTLNRNFMGYTTHKGASLFGFGASAISSLEHGFSQNEKDPQRYQARVAERTLPTVRGLLRNDDDILRGELIEAILCSGRVEWNSFHDPRVQSLYEAALPELAVLAEDGLVLLNGESLTVTELGRYFARNIASVFDAYLAQHKRREQKVFSQAL